MKKAEKYYINMAKTDTWTYYDSISRIAPKCSSWWNLLVWWEKTERKIVENRGVTKHVGATERCGKWRLYFRHFSFRYFSFSSFSMHPNLLIYIVSRRIHRNKVNGPICGLILPLLPSTSKSNKRKESLKLNFNLIDWIWFCLLRINRQTCVVE